MSTNDSKGTTEERNDLPLSPAVAHAIADDLAQRGLKPDSDPFSLPPAGSGKSILDQGLRQS